MTETEMIEKIEARSYEQIRAILDPYIDKFCESITLNCMPLEDLARLEEIVEECIATGKPYDNYMPYPDDPDILIDY